MSKRFIVLTVLCTVCLIASNLFEIKIFAAGPLTLTGGFLIFPISYIINDFVTEVYGFKNARFMIYMAFLMNLFIVLMAQLVRILPEAPFWDGQAHFDYIFTADLRITAASMLAFLLGSVLNSWVLSRMKQKNNRFGFAGRSILSSLYGETVDSIIFFPIAFWGVGARNLLIMMVTQIVLKTLYEVVMLPITVRIVKYLRTDETNR